MFVIGENKLVSLDIVEEQFACQLQECKGACCWEGDYGAPLNKLELEILEQIYPKIEGYLTEEGKKAIAEQGHYVYIAEEEEYATTLINNRACAYLTTDTNGIAKCGIEKAYEDGVVDFQKPISCHLYPIRVQELSNDFEALNYSRWDICSAACSAGKKDKIPVYKFVKNALIRKYGEDFYNELDAAAQYHFSNKE